MSKDDLARCEGRIIDLIGGGIFDIQLENGIRIHAKLCGKMKRFRIRVVVGDKVLVGISPYDLSHGLIIHRLKA